MASDLDIANRALSRLGAARIATLGDDTKNGRAVKSALELVRTEVLTDHPWNCAVKRLTLYVRKKTATSYSGSGVEIVGGAQLTVGAGHGFEVGDPISVAGVSSTIAPAVSYVNGDWLVARPTMYGATFTDVIKLVDPATGLPLIKETGGAFSVTIAGTVTLRSLYGSAYPYDLPADCLRVLEVEGQGGSWGGWGYGYYGAAWGVESGRLLADSGSPLAVRYIWRNEETETYPPLLVSAFAARLASELALEVVDSPAKRQLADADYAGLLSRAKRADGQEQTPSELAEGAWITARFTG